MEKFYLGMDIGTNSVGMACTDEEYNLLRAKGKDCWAVRLFDESSTAAERRVARTARRRLARRKERIKWLQGLFAPYIKDETFFIRLNNSPYLAEDKDEVLQGGADALFADGDFDDKSFHSRYPTIFHLRKSLMGDSVCDLRLYYLAIHHIVKYRGHFLFEGGMAEIRDIGRLFTQLNAVCEDLYDGVCEEIPYFDPTKAEEGKKILLSRGKDKQKTLENLFGAKTSLFKEIIKGICGYKVKPVILFCGKYEEEKSISFQDLTDEAFEGLQATYGDDFILLSSMRAIYNFVTFERLLEGNADISSAMIALYEKHKRDLRLLKDFVHTNATQEEYNRLFKATDQTANYVNYIGYTKKGGEKKKVKRCKDEDFYAYLKKFINSLKSVRDEEEKNRILAEIEKKAFLPKILHADNGLFPRQINEDELNKILANMVKNCPETAEIAEKIPQLFSYRIPYFVGPLTGAHGWAVRKGEGKITPWNFDEMIDKAASNEGFMRRMTNKCSYLHGEDVLPKASICYQKFNVLNQINKLKVNGQAIGVELKQAIYNELFLTCKKVTDNGIRNLLVRHGMISEAQKKETTLEGKDGELTASLSSYIQLKKILGDFVDEDLKQKESVCEKIILWHTLNTDKNIVEELILKNYGEIPVVRKNIKALKGLVFKDFGRLSQKFLTGLKATDKSTGQIMSVLDILYETNENLNEILFDENYDLQELIARENGETNGEITLEDVEKLYVSPAVRRGIWQSLKMADEYISAIGREPDKIFVEVTREDGVKGDAGRTVSRQKQLLEKYKEVKAEDAEGFAELKEALEKETDMKLRQERLYLYYRQLGKCMYSGEQIDLGELSSDRYDVDHILPRTFIKDDSLDNKVLVRRTLNAKKDDAYPIPAEIVSEKARRHWELLRRKNLISDTTYQRLTRRDELREEEYQDFINRQKTITDQTAKAVAELLKKKYPQTKIVYSKAKNVSEFRQKFDLFKCRETNDLHHARDAYLNVVVGNVFDTCSWRNYNLKTMFYRNVAGAWVKDGDRSITKVKEVISKAHSIRVTRYSYCNKGGFYAKMKILPKGNPDNPPLKGKGPLSDPLKYGGRTALNYAYFVAVKTPTKKGTETKICAIPVLVALQERQHEGAVEKYLTEEVGLKDFEIVVKTIKRDSLVKINGYPFWLVGGGGTKDPRILFHNALQWYTDGKTDLYVKALKKLIGYADEKTVDENLGEYVIYTNRFHKKKVTVNAQENMKLYSLIIEQLEKDVYKKVKDVFTAYSNLLEFLNDNREKFLALSVIRQSRLLLNLVAFLKAGSSCVDLKLLGRSEKTGLLRCGNTITKMNFIIVHQSPCGLTEREQKI